MQRHASHDSRRRHFLRGLANMPAAAAVVALPGVANAAPVADPEPTDKHAGKGYRLTRHIVDYYKTAAL